MKMLAACEYSGIVREAFAAKGWEAWSCDILPTEQPSERHYKGSVLDLFENSYIRNGLYKMPENFDLIISFPPCTYLTYAGMANWYDAGRAEKRIEAADFFMKMYNAPAKYIAVENPQGIMSKIFRQPDQVIHTYYFGESEMKRTCLWLKNLPPLVWHKEDNLFGSKTATEKPEPVMCYTRKSDGRKMKQYGAWGVPAKQLDFIFKQNYKGIMHLTLIMQNLASIPKEIYLKSGITEKMYKKCKTIFLSKSQNIIENWLYCQGITGITGIKHNGMIKNYFYFKL